MPWTLRIRVPSSIGLLTTAEPQVEHDCENDAHDDAGHYGEVDDDLSAPNDDISRQPPETETIDQDETKPDQSRHPSHDEEHLADLKHEEVPSHEASTLGRSQHSVRGPVAG